MVLGKSYDGQNCSVARALEIVGERWSLLIIRDALFAGRTRFGDFQRNLGIAPNILTTRLEGFVAAGLMVRRLYSEQPEHYEYVLTDKGLDLHPVVVALCAWGDRWEAPNGPPIIYKHTECGHGVHQHISCPTCGEVTDAREVVVRRGPGTRPEDFPDLPQTIRPGAT